jgi:hypothetical protein
VIVEHLQQQLEGIYGFVTVHRASAFLVGRGDLETLGTPVEAQEQLFVLEENGALEVGLYLDPGLLARLAGADPQGRSGLSLVTSELPAFTTVAEGVSHFVYLLRCASRGRSVSRLELELQAEVDKFAVAALHLWGRGLRQGVGALCRRLFGEYTLRPELTAEEAQRYETANHLAFDFARFLFQRYVEPGRLDGFLAELRDLYGRSGADKRHHVLARAA